jgi:3-deoxy-D-manno-octulosonate 8-phosphate phosphatase (KDO 8-P phosphatase)
MELDNLFINELITDVDGVLTDGKFFYSDEGKILKQFGPHDSDGFKIIKSLGIRVTAISADHRGFSITNKRLDDMGIGVHLVSEKERLNWVRKHCVLDRTAFVGDGLYDAAVMKVCALSFAPYNALDITKDVASYVTKASGGNGVMFEVGMELLRMYDLARHRKYLEGNTDE